MALLATVQAAALPPIDLLAEDIKPASLPYHPSQIHKRALSGVNNFDCKLTPRRPRPLLLVHATLLTEESWWTMVPFLIRDGYCVFTLTYGRYKDIPIVGAIGPVETSAQEVATFGDSVLQRMNVTQLDYVGHSQGGILGRYWAKYLGGAGKINRQVIPPFLCKVKDYVNEFVMVGIAPINHGTTLNGITTIAKALKIFYPAQPVFDSFAPALYQLVEGSDFIKKLNAGGDITPGVIHSVIATKYDEVVTPYDTAYLYDAGVTNQLLQMTIINSKIVIRWVMNQLDPLTAKSVNCLTPVTFW
ncbi:hypothetical protein BGZ76_009427 [Entomortierella beljakovae]|nr:hypothetical protein BGZ76_009427 [Entomortierella beljakovae]